MPCADEPGHGFIESTSLPRRLQNYTGKALDFKEATPARVEVVGGKPTVIRIVALER